MVFRPEPATDDYQKRIDETRAVPATSMAAAPLVSGDITTGVLGFVKFGDRAWSHEELNALEAIASLFAQVQARVQAEEQLRYLAEHDDLTGLHNRRALIAHLDDRLADGRVPDRCRLLFFDLDRLKAINDYLGHNAGDWFIRVFAERLREAPNQRGPDRPTRRRRIRRRPRRPMDAEAAEALAERLQSTLRERVSIDGEMLTRTVSIGVALGEFPGRDTTSDLLRQADQAVLTAKSSGGNKIAVFSDDMSMRERLPQRHRASSAGRHRERRAGAALPARDRHAHRRGSWPPRPWSAGSIRPADCCRRSRSSGSPNPSIWQANWVAG